MPCRDSCFRKVIPMQCNQSEKISDRRNAKGQYNTGKNDSQGCWCKKVDSRSRQQCMVYIRSTGASSDVVKWKGFPLREPLFVMVFFTALKLYFCVFWSELRKLYFLLLLLAIIWNVMTKVVTFSSPIGEKTIFNTVKQTLLKLLSKIMFCT